MQHSVLNRNNQKTRNYWTAIFAAACALIPAQRAACETVTTASDPLLDLFIKKGFVTVEEAQRVKAEADMLRTNGVETAAVPQSKWKISSGIKSVELFGDIRLRYESRTATDPRGGNIDLNRLRYAIRLGLRGKMFDDFYYGLRMETSTNPRSSWGTFGSSSTGPFGKSTAGINLSQVYLGWTPEDWVEVTLGKMPNPLYTTPLVWDPDLNPEGAAEKFKYTVGEADFFAIFGQFLYQDTNPTHASSGYFNPLTTNSGNLPFLATWQLGMDYHLTKKVDLKVAPQLYTYTRFQSGHAVSFSYSPDFSGTYIGQGSTAGPTGAASYNLGSFDGFYANQTGINDLLVLEFPFELNFKLEHFELQFFGDYAQNLEGRDRAKAAYNAAAALEAYYNSGGGSTLAPISSPQTGDNKAYQFGFAVGSKDALGLVYGTTSKKHSWEFRTYWQHVEQYALDPNLIDSDFFEGRENMQGIYAALAYGITDNFIGTIRYGHASRINNKLGTGGSNQDIPQMNPINAYDLFQFDLTLKF